MRRTLLLTLLVLAVSPTALAQTEPPPPDLLLVIREDIKPGKMPAHEREAMQFVRVQAQANARLAPELRDARLAMTPIAGNTNEVLYLHPYRSLADMEARNREFEKLATGAMKVDFDALPDAELHAAQVQMVARFRPDLSTNIGTMHVAQARYMMITTLRLKPGTEDEYWETFKKINWAAREKVGDKASVAVYAVGAGAPGTTYLIIRPLKSLAEMDTPGGRVRAAMSDDGRKEIDKMRDKAVVFANSLLYAFNPRLSLVGKEFAARDTSTTAFWITEPQGPPPPAAAARRNGPRRGGRP